MGYELEPVASGDGLLERTNKGVNKSNGKESKFVGSDLPSAQVGLSWETGQSYSQGMVSLNPVDWVKGLAGSLRRMASFSFTEKDHQHQLDQDPST